MLLDASQRATGVEYLKGERLYRAHPDSSDGSGEPCQARATREVILCGGAFNTPQLLMLSGIGPRAALSRSGIKPGWILRVSARISKTAMRLAWSIA